MIVLSERYFSFYSKSSLVSKFEAFEVRTEKNIIGW